MLNFQSSSPVLVVGPGRSGTTVTARLLHERLGVHMGSRFRPDPQGKSHYEDLAFKDLNDHFLSNRLNFNEWLGGVQRLVFERIEMDKPWGFKDPRASYLVGLYLMFFDDPKFIRCRRRHDKILESMLRNYEWTKDQAENIIQERELALDRFLKGREVLELNFDEFIPEEDLEEKLKIFLNGGRGHEG